MKRTGLQLLGTVFVILLAVPAFLYERTQALNASTQNQVMAALRELKQLDAEWNANILKTRAGMHNNYDPLSAPLPHVHELQQRLAMSPPMSHAELLQKRLEDMERAFVAKEDLVEQFKSQNALLRNSLRYFPTAVETFKELLASLPPTDQSTLHLLGEVIDGLLRDVLRFNLLPEERLGEKISATLKTLDNNSGDYPDVLLEPLTLLARHASITLRQRVVEDTLMARIANTPTAQTIDDLSAALEQAFQGMLEQKQHYRNYLFLYSGVLLALLAYAAWRLLHSYRTIAQVNQHLQTANETLEQRVAERTAELQRQSAQLKELATRDTLTGLINRRQLMVELTDSLLRAERRDWVVALMYFDLDGFKGVNDKYGHATGDLLLQEVAARIKRHVRKEDTFARLGGDEFVILLNQVSTPEGAIRVAQAILQELRALTQVAGHTVRISASIGIGSLRGAANLEQAGEQLLNQADQAMYQAKQQGKNAYCLSLPHAWD
nr:DAHL domain-containing protein [uncultured Pseudomonas sp.]